MKLSAVKGWHRDLGAVNLAQVHSKEDFTVGKIPDLKY